MSMLFIKSRPFVRFDPTNRDHRQIYTTFCISRSWQHSPVHFYLEQGYGDIIAMIENKLSSYYLSKEFKKKVADRGENWSVEMFGT